MREKPLILIVDDEKSFSEIFSAKLQSVGFEIATAQNEAEAISQTEKLAPDLILMDIMMPGATGTDAALAIKQNPKTKNIKIAFLTSAKEPWPGIAADHKNLSKELGMEDFLEKTDDLDRIVDKVREILGREQ